MSRAPTAPAAPSRPTVVDYVFLLGGCTLSMYLLALSPIHVKPHGDNPSPVLHEFVAYLPKTMRLPEGVLLVGPIFYVTQLVRRRQGLTAVEWLWAISWLGVAVLTGLAAWQRSGELPEFLQPYATTPRKLWYLIFVPSMAALAVVLGVVGMVRRGSAPWTHTFGLVLLVWPIAPLLGILSLGKFL